MSGVTLKFNMFRISGNVNLWYLEISVHVMQGHHIFSHGNIQYPVNIYMQEGFSCCFVDSAPAEWQHQIKGVTPLM